ncbi:transglycosylase family protein [Streptomyces sp. NPDC090106]|uniref:transglycosylase family protein n=1 Tax=Streptomyces sp. NPDC090106 TaxID=3365946 RepID=UPI00381A477E
MLSGNGRHRRPRQAPALLVAAGVTGSAIAIPLLGAGAASAADGSTWDQVAQCETDGSWSANDGDGEYGGLNLSQEDWEEYGGLDYAPSADLASRNQQIAVAEKVLADQGVGAWGACGLLNGLGHDDATADVDTGVASGSPSADESESSDSSDSSSSSGSSGLSNSTGSPDSGASADEDADASASPETSASPDKSAKSDSSASDSEQSQSPDGSPTIPANEGESDNSWQEGGSSGLVDMSDLGSSEATTKIAGKHRGAQAEESAYTVREGDTLASIADSLGLDGGWRHLYALNKGVIGSDPSAIAPGQSLVVGIGQAAE